MNYLTNIHLEFYGYTNAKLRQCGQVKAVTKSKQKHAAKLVKYIQRSRSGK